MQTVNNRSNKALFKLPIAFSNFLIALYRSIKVHPCDLNEGSQLVNHLMNY